MRYYVIYSYNAIDNIYDDNDEHYFYHKIICYIQFNFVRLQNNNNII